MLKHQNRSAEVRANRQLDQTNENFEAAPNVWIIGAPKCGTSSAFQWLKAHPAVEGTCPKETYCLVDSQNPLSLRKEWDGRDWAAFARLHGLGGGEKNGVRLEGSTHHFYQRVAIETIPKIPGSRVLVLLRDPAERVYSSFRYTKYTKRVIPDDFGFKQLVEGGPRLESMLNVLERNHPDEAFILRRDIDFSHYSEWLDPWWKLLGPERIRVVFLEAVHDDPRREFTSLAEFLGIDPSFYAGYDFPVQNRTVRVIYPFLAKIVRWLPDWLKVNQMKAWYRRVQHAEVPEPAEDRGALQELKKRMADEVMRLEGRFGVPASRWWGSDAERDKR